MQNSLENLQKAVKALSPEELARFRRWFEAFDAQRWDKQFEDDVRAGKLDRVAEEALQAYQAGKAKEL